MVFVGMTQRMHVSARWPAAATKMREAESASLLA
jgi:hypothetical protein